MNIEQSDAKIFKYSFELTINKPADTVWGIMCGQINEWWMNDFRVLGPESKVTLTASTGGTLLETDNNGQMLEWYRVQMCVPGESMYLVGYIAPDWGGPTTSMLKLELKPLGEKTVLTVTDALLGNVSETSTKNIQNGWFDMFSNGLKAFSESQ